MKHLILTVAIAITTSVNAQWINTKNDTNQRICINKNQNGQKVNLFNFDKETEMYLEVETPCPFGHLSGSVFFLVGEKWIECHCDLVNIGSIIVVQKDLFGHLIDSKFIESFKKSSKIRIVINNKECSDLMFEFSMAGSVAALNYIKNKL
jgi:hypothetical protein